MLKFVKTTFYAYMHISDSTYANMYVYQFDKQDSPNGFTSCLGVTYFDVKANPLNIVSQLPMIFSSFLEQIRVSNKEYEEV